MVIISARTYAFRKGSVKYRIVLPLNRRPYDQTSYHADCSSEVFYTPAALQYP